MFANGKTLFGCILASFLFVALGVPSTAAAVDLEKASIRTQFASSLTQGDRVSFTDDKFEKYSKNGLSGYIATNDVFGVFVLEGDQTDVQNAIDDLRTDGRLAGVEVVDRTNGSSATHSSLASHTELDPRNNADAEAFNEEVKKVRVRAKYAGNVAETEKLNWHDNHFDEFAEDGLGGLFIPGDGHNFMTIELEGPEVRVDYWVDQLQSDEHLEFAEVLSTEYNAAMTADELVSHTWKDERKSN